MSALENDYEFMDFDEYMENLRLENVAMMYSKIPGQESSYEEILKALKATESYNKSLYEKTDALLEYSDEIIEIIELDEGYTTDISVAGDQLFYANGILTKNSAGLPATADFILAVIETEELAQQGRQLVKQIKSRYGDKNLWNKFLIGVKKGNQRWVELDENAQFSGVSGSAHKNENLPLNQEKLPPRARLDSLVEELSQAANGGISLDGINV